jgi:hypothetical protein
MKRQQGDEGMLRDDTKRLCDQIHSMRKVRATLLSDLQNGAKELKQTVTDLRAHFHRARTTMAKRTKHERVMFVGNLRRSMGNDLAGARRAWAGKSA